MRADVPGHDLVSPRSLDEALTLLASRPGELRPIAGGTDLMVLFSAGRLPYRSLLSLWRLGELREVSETPGAVTLGALTTYTDVQAHPTLRAEFPMLCQAASETGGLAIQNRGTLGGNIANASPAADSPPALLAYDAEIELASASGARWLPYRSFHTGYKQTVMRPDEIVSRVRLARAPGERVHFYRKVGPRRAQAISKVCFAGVADLEGGRLVRARIAVGGVAPVVLPCLATEALLSSGGLDAAEASVARVGQEVTPIDDLRSTQRYRRRVTQNLLEQFLERVRRAAAGGWSAGSVNTEPAL